MLASSSRTAIRQTQSKISPVASQAARSIEEPRPRCIHRRYASTALRQKDSQRNTASLSAAKTKGIRSEPWQFTPDHSFQSTHRTSAVARFQLDISRNAERGQFINCLEVCKAMKEKGIRPNLPIYNDLLKAASMDGLFMEVEAIMDDMLAMGIEPDRQSYHHLIHSKRALEADEMWKILEEMNEIGLTPNAQTFTQIMERPLLGENVEMAVQYMGEMLARGIVPELQTAQRAIILATSFGHAKLALDMANKFEEHSVRRLDNEVWVNCLIVSAENLYEEGVLQGWQKVVHDLGITPDEGLCIEVLHTVARHGLPDLGTDVLRVLKLVGASWKEFHLASMIEALCKANRLKEAFETLHVMRSNHIHPVNETTHPIFNIIKKDVEAIDRTWAMLDELKEEGKGVDITAINVLIQASVFFGDVQRAVGTYKSIPEYGIQPNVDTFNLLLSACISVGHRSLGDHLLGEMKAASIKPDARTYERLIILCLTQPTYEDAFFYLEEMKGHKFLPTLGIYDAVVRKCVSVGDTRYKLALDEMKQCGYGVPASLQDFIARDGTFEAQSPKVVAPKEHEGAVEGQISS